MQNQKFVFTRLIPRRSENNSATVYAQTEQQARALAEAQLQTENIRRHIPVTTVLHRLTVSNASQAQCELALDLAQEFESDLGSVILPRYNRDNGLCKLILSSTTELEGLYHALVANLPGAQITK